MRAAALLLLAGLASPALAAGEAPASTGAEAGVGLPDFQTASRTRMMQADADHDGKLSASELSAATRGGGGGNGRDAGRMFTLLDANGDGFLDAAEIDAMSARRFARMDVNGDSKVTEEEREAIRSQRRGGMGRGLGWRSRARQPMPDQPNLDRQAD